MLEYQRIWRTAGLRHILSISTKNNDPFIILSPKRRITQVHPDILVEPFSFYWHRVCHPIRLIWTYWELDEDMRVSPDMERVDLMKSIMRAKHLRDEQICWWPLATATGTQLPYTARPDIMASMIRLFAPTHVFCFGEQAQHSLKNYLSSTHIHIPDQTTIISLPGPEEMLPDNQDKKMQTWHIIKDLQL